MVEFGQENDLPFDCNNIYTAASTALTYCINGLQFRQNIYRKISEYLGQMVKHKQRVSMTQIEIC
jgi:hypothetical protein